jgi:hypothetical protein
MKEIAGKVTWKMALLGFSVSMFFIFQWLMS